MCARQEGGQGLPGEVGNPLDDGIKNMIIDAFNRFRSGHEQARICFLEPRFLAPS